MRGLLLIFAGLAIAGNAAAASVDTVISGRDGNNSISTISCADCPAPRVTTKNTYIVPEVAPGTDRVELKDIGGEMKLVRTEAWLGGSPVVFVSKASDEVIQAAKAKTMPSQQTAKAAIGSVPVEAQATATIAIVDSSAKTGSLATPSTVGTGALTERDTPLQEVDLQNFRLRLN